MEALVMKKSLFWILAVLAIIVAGMPVNLFAEADGRTQAGVAASVEGEVKATTPPAKRAHLLKNGDPIFMGDKIETGAVGQLQIKLLDETVFTLGPLSTITVDEFVYDPGNAENKTNVVKGILRAVSGKVTQQKPEDVPADFSGGAGPSEKAPVKDVREASFSKAQEDALKLAELIGARDAAKRPVRKPASKVQN